MWVRGSTDESHRSHLSHIWMKIRTSSLLTFPWISNSVSTENKHNFCLQRKSHLRCIFMPALFHSHKRICGQERWCSTHHATAITPRKRGKNGRFSILLLRIHPSPQCFGVSYQKIPNSPLQFEKSRFKAELILPWFLSWHFPCFVHTSKFLTAAEKERQGP